MMTILVSGLVNTETTVSVRKFPIDYYPIDYPFFGVNTAVSGVAYNLTKSLWTLGDAVVLTSICADDFAGAYIRSVLQGDGISGESIKHLLSQTPSSVVLYDPEGKRQIYCDLKDIQETAYGFPADICDDIDVVIACNINFNRPLLHLAKKAGRKIATDVHVLSNIYDDYNREFMENADILFLSDEALGWDHQGFLRELASVYGNEIIVLGRGSKGAAIYTRSDEKIREFPAAHVGEVVNTVGAGDALFSSFVHYYGKGFDPVSALIRAQLFASAKIGVSGASSGFVTEARVEDLFRIHGRELMADIIEF